MKNGTLKYRVGQLEKQCDAMDRRLEELMENHLPHIREEIASLRTRINVLTAVNIGGIITGILIAKYL